MQAIILAAGMGKRLKDLTKDNTKCMVKVNGVTLIERMLSQLDRLSLSMIVVVVGYKGEELIDYISGLDISTKIKFVKNSVYDKTNNIYSLYLAKDYLAEEDTLLLESDLIFEDSVLKMLIDDPRETLALVDKYESWMDGTCVKISADSSIESFVPGKKFVYNDIPEYYKTVNIYKFSSDFSTNFYVPFLEAYSKALGKNEYYEQVLRVITMLDDSGIKAKKLHGQLWYEIDDVQDLDIASSMFAPNRADKLKAVQKRYGGYWRYPHMLDFCYLVNLCFPTEKMVDEMKSSFEKLLRQYPSGMNVNRLLAAKNFGVQQKHIVVGNGAAELIKEWLAMFSGKIGIIRPTFEEYVNRYEADRQVIFETKSLDYMYGADDIIAFYAEHSVDAILLINPDNPSGNYIEKKEVFRLLDWCKEKNIELLLDESFVDFADEDDSTMISEEVLNNYPNLIIMKSISKSYGVPGVRLGVMVSSDEDLIQKIAGAVSIWNINSFGEFFMQIMEKYASDYKAGLVEIKNVRKRFLEELKAIKALHVYPTQANYVLVEVRGGMTATELTERLLVEYNILIKDLTSKFTDDERQYIRLAVRSEEDNTKLIDALKALLEA